MKILYTILDSGIPLYGSKGASAHVRSVATALSEIGDEVTVVVRNVGESEPSSLPDNVEVVPISPESSVDSLTSVVQKTSASKELKTLFQNSDDYRALTKLVEEKRPDAILERLSLFSLAPLAVCKRFRIRFLLEVDAPISDEAAAYRGLTLYDTARFVERTVISGADMILPVSSVLRDWLIKEGVDPAQIRVLPNGVDTARFDPALAKERRKDFGLESDAHVIGFVSGLRPWHGLRLLTEVFDLIATRDQKAMLLIVGDGPQRESLEHWQRSSASGNRARIIGHVPHGDVPDLLATMDVVVIPYESNSNFYFSPLKLLEAMSLGKPIVATAVGDIPELLEHGTAGMIVPPGNPEAFASATQMLLQNQALGAKMGKIGRKLAVEKHDWRSVARKIDESIRAVKEEVKLV